MAFHLEYGPSYVHADAEVALNIQRQSLVSETGIHYGERQTWIITGFLQADTQSDLDTAIDDLEAAYAVDGGDLKLVKGDGSDTEHVILNAGTLGGVRVVSGPSYPEGNRGEYSTFRQYTITLEADLPLTTTNIIMQWEETIEFIGDGGAQFAFLPVLTGTWQKQQTTQTSTYQAIQSGSSTGLYDWLPVPTPLWPAAEHTSQRRIRTRGPKWRWNNGSGLWQAQEHSRSWTYVFEDTASVGGVPTPI